MAAVDDVDTLSGLEELFNCCVSQALSHESAVLLTDLEVDESVVGSGKGLTHSSWCT